MKEFFKDYVNAQKVSWEFQKKHWLGNLIATAVISGATVGTMALIKHCQKKKCKKETVNEVCILELDV